MTFTYSSTKTRNWRLWRRITAFFGAAGLVSSGILAGGSPAAQAADEPWVASWAASPSDSATPIDAAGLAVPQSTSNQTLRMIITPHLGGSTLRLHLSNRFGSAATTFGQVTVGAQGTGSASGITTATFSGETQVTVPAGQDVISDPVRFTFQAFAPLAVSIYLPGLQGAPTKHFNANATSFYAAPLTGNLTTVSNNVAFPLKTEAWFYVDGLDIQAAPTTQSIVAFGDSITDGTVAADVASFPVTLSVADKNGRYPDDLQRRIDAAGMRLSVINAGIAGNRLLADGGGLFPGPSGLQRFKADALDQAGVKGVLLLEGINDLGIPPATTTAAQLIAGYQQAISAAHAAGKEIWLGTITPASNALFDGTLLAPQSETYREQINAWIRTQKLADGFVDFDAAVRDPANPTVLNPDYAGPDNLHPNLLGYQIMANAVDLAMLEV